MKEIEELLEECICTCGLIKGDESGVKHKAEILKLFADQEQRLKKKQHRIDELNKKWKWYEQELANKILLVRGLEAQVAKMKCCGNCKHIGINYQRIPYCDLLGKLTSCCDKCDKWEAR